MYPSGCVLFNRVKSAWFEVHGAPKFIFALVNNLDWAGPDYIHVITNSINEITNKKKNKISTKETVTIYVHT